MADDDSISSSLLGNTSRSALDDTNNMDDTSNDADDTLLDNDADLTSAFVSDTADEERFTKNYCFY